MAIDTQHPLYADSLPDWQLMRDSYRGERRIKARGSLYLPTTSGMEASDVNTPGSIGYKAYQAYKIRAVYHDFISVAIESAIGSMHSKPPLIELPPALEPMRSRAALSGETLPILMRRINEQQLITGRVGLMLDIHIDKQTNVPMPYIAIYDAESIINWDDNLVDRDTSDLSLVVLRESGFEREAGEYSWSAVVRHRSLEFRNGIYVQKIFRDSEFVDEVAPSLRGETLKEIPFVFANSKDLVSTPDDPPLLGLARLALAIYRGEADYRQNLFMQSQDTLVIIADIPDEDAQKVVKIGAGSYIRLPSTSKAEYIGINSKGLPEQREALENDKQVARDKAGRLIVADSKEKESGEALHVRVAAQTATLNHVSLTGAAALERLLKIAAKWVGADPDQVKIIPNTDFIQSPFKSHELVELMTAKNMGAPISLDTIHQIMVERGATNKNFEEELDLIKEEGPLSADFRMNDEMNEEISEKV